MSVTIDTNPQGAELRLNGKPLGLTPWKGKLDKKLYDIELNLSGFQPLLIPGINPFDLSSTTSQAGTVELLGAKTILCTYNLYYGDLIKDLNRAVEIQDKNKLLVLLEHESMTDQMRMDLFSRLIDGKSQDILTGIIDWVKSDPSRLSLKHHFFRIAYVRKYQSGIASLFPLPDDVNKSLPDGSTPLIDAVKNDNPELIDYLLKADAKVSLTDKEGKLPIQWALDLKLFRPLFAFQDNGIDTFSFNGKNPGDSMILANYRLKYAASQLAAHPDADYLARLNAVYVLVTGWIPFDSLDQDVHRMYYFSKALYYVSVKNNNSAIAFLLEAIKYGKDNTNHLYFYGHLFNIDLFSWEVSQADDVPEDKITLELAKAYMRADQYTVATYWVALSIRLRPDLYEWYQTTPELAPLNQGNEIFSKMIEEENPGFL